MSRFRSILITIICSILILALSFSSFSVMDYLMFRNDSNITTLSISDSINSTDIDQQLQVFPWDTEEYKAFEPTYDNHWPFGSGGYGSELSYLWDYLEIYINNVLGTKLDSLTFAQTRIQIVSKEDFINNPFIFEFIYQKGTESDEQTYYYNLVIDQAVYFNEDPSTQYQFQAAMTDNAIYSVRIIPIRNQTDSGDFQSVLQSSYENLQQKPVDKIQTNLLYTYMAADKNNQLDNYSPYGNYENFYDFLIETSTKLIKTSDQLVCFSYIPSFLYFLWFDPYTCDFIGYDFVYLRSKYSFESPTLGLIDKDFSDIIYNN